MNFYKLDYTIEKTLQQHQTTEQKFLKQFTNEDFSKADAKYIFEKIGDHKWYVSEKLQRDVGLAVAAIDYFENFHKVEFKSKNLGVFGKSKLTDYEYLMLTI